MNKLITEDKKIIFTYYWKVLGHDRNYREEYQFDPGRLYRFDYAWPEKMIAVEVDGNAWNVKGGGRHSQDSDRNKMNIAALLGWRVFHFSPQMLINDPDSCIDIVWRAVSAA